MESSRIKRRLNTPAASAPTVWHKVECPTSGARWTYTADWLKETVCTFSGCGCGKRLIDRGSTTERGESADWFFRPESCMFT
jgi:hypothetical protein